MNRPHHTNPALIALVAAGGAVGSLARYALSHALPPRHGLPVATLLENLSGAFVLGLLLESLALAGHETPERRRLRLALGTGVLGGYTTYSSFALELRGLLADDRAALAFAYALGSVVVGTLACWLGVLLAATVRGRRSRLPVDPDALDAGDSGGTEAGYELSDDLDEFAHAGESS
jgi:CrcB protein